MFVCERRASVCVVCAVERNGIYGILYVLGDLIYLLSKKRAGDRVKNRSCCK